MATPFKVREVQSGVRRIQIQMPVAAGIKLEFNVYAFKTESGTSLFDCGPETTVPVLQSALGTEHVTNVFLTHGHADHAGSGGYWLKQGAKVLVPEADLTMLHSGGPCGRAQSIHLYRI